MLERFRSGATTYRQTRLWPFYIIFICFAATLACFPGVGDSDTWDQQGQMLARAYNDWHPPVFAALWGVLNRAWNAVSGMDYAGTGIIYLLHSLLLWGGLALLMKAASPYFRTFNGEARWKFSALAGGLLLWGLCEMVPMSRFVFKDTAMLAAYTLALGLMLNMPARRSLKVFMVMACLLLLFYGTAVRHNALFAMLPLLALLFCKTFPRRRLLVIVPCTLIVWGGILLGINYVNYTVLAAKKTYSIQEVFYGDIWRLNYKTKVFDLPPTAQGVYGEGLSEEVFFDFYDDKRVYVVSAMRFIDRYYENYFDKDATRLNNGSTGAEGDFELLFQAWIDKIKKHPAAYISTHKRLFVNLLREYTFFGLPGYWYFVLSVVIVLIGLLRLIKRKPDTDPAPYLITLSGLFYVLPYFMFIVDIQRRYLFWLIFASSIGIIWIGGQFAAKRSGQAKCLPAPE